MHNPDGSSSSYDYHGSDGWCLPRRCCEEWRGPRQRAPLTEQLSNTRFLTTVDRLLGTGEQALTIRVMSQQICACGCKQTVTTGRKFINQAHYDRSRGLSGTDAERLVARFVQGTSKRQLAREFGVALTTVKRLLRRRGVRR